MTRIEELVQRLSTLQDEFGRFTFDQALKTVRRRKLLTPQGERPRRKRFSWSKYESLYQKQRGICPLCKRVMVLLRREVEIDHLDPNRQQGFNDDDNLQLTHRRCNRKKSSRSVYEQAKKTNRSIMELVGGCTP